MARSRTAKLILAAPRNTNLPFDLRKDPLETNNLYGSPQHRNEIGRIEAALSAWRSKEPKAHIYRSIDAPQANRPNVPPRDLSHRNTTMQYYRRKMHALQKPRA